MLIQFNAKFKCGDLAISKSNERVRIVSLRYELTSSTQDIYYYTRNIISGAYFWFSEDSLSLVKEFSKLSELPELPF